MKTPRHYRSLLSLGGLSLAGLSLGRLLLAAALPLLPNLAVAQEASSFEAPAGSKILRLATLQWQPYIGTDLPDNGYAYQLAKAAFAASGYQLDVGFYPWARALRLASSASTVSGLFPEYYSASREADFVYSDPFPGGPIGLCKRVDDDTAFTVDPTKDAEQALRALSHKRFGVVREYINTPEIDNADYLKKQAAGSDELNLKKLRYRRIDLAVIDPYVARYLLDTRLPEYEGSIEMMQPPLEFKSLYIAFSRRDPNHLAYANAFNAGLKQLRESGQLEAMLRQYGFDDVAERVSEGL